MSKKIYIVGIGMDGRETLTAEAKRIIEAADCLIGSGRVLEPFETIGKPLFNCFKAAQIAQFIADFEYEIFAVLMSGDCGFYSGAKSLLPFFSDNPEYETEVISGISSPMYFCNKLKIPWQNIKLISLHGKSGNIARNTAANYRCLFLLGETKDVSTVCKTLVEYGLGDVTIYVGENLSYPSEKIRKGKARDLTGIETSPLCVLLTENRNYERAVRCGISDDEFIRNTVPMTKSEVRTLVVSKLEIAPHDIVWDIGSGTGSVSVEAALRCPDGTVFAADCKPEAAELTRRNARSFHCDNIMVTEGNAPECLNVFPAPDKVFIGGSGGNMREILACAFERNPQATAVVTAVTLESISAAVSAFAAIGIKKPEIIQALITRTNYVGNYSMLKAENPVFIIRGAKPCAE